MTPRRAGSPVPLPIALVFCAFGLVLGVATPARAETPDPATTASAQATAAPATAFDIDLVAPGSVRDYLDRHLELKRYRELTDLDAGELARLMDSARDNVQELLGTLGYFSPTVEITLDKPRTVRIHVEPGTATRIAEVDITFAGPIAKNAPAEAAPGTVPPPEPGSPPAPDPDLAQRRDIRSDWLLRRGNVFTQGAWDDAKARALRTLSARKYPTGRIAASRADIDADAANAKLFVTLDSGPAYKLGAMQVSGSEHYPPELATRLARLSTGSDYDQNALLEAQQRLADSGFFASAFIALDTSGDPEAAPVQVQVRDAPLQKLVFGVGASTDSGPRVSVEHTHNLLPGLGWRAVSKLSLDRKTQSLGSDLIAPPDDSSWRWIASGLVQRQDAADVEIASQRLRFGRTKPGDTIDRTYYLQYERAHTTGASTDEIADSVSLNYAWTLRRFDSIVTPTRGWGLAVEVGGGYTLGSDPQPFTRTLARWQAFFPLATSERSGLPSLRAGRIATRLEGGAVIARQRAELPASQLFLTGGDTTVRGYGLREIGAVQADGTIAPGRYLGVASVEYQKPIVRNDRVTDWEAAVFVDAGAVADRVGEMKTKVGVGAGARWKSPFGPLAIDLAYGLATHKFRLHLNVGFTF